MCVLLNCLILPSWAGSRITQWSGLNSFFAPLVARVGSHDPFVDSGKCNTPPHQKRRSFTGYLKLLPKFPEIARLLPPKCVGIQVSDSTLINVSATSTAASGSIQSLRARASQIDQATAVQPDARSATKARRYNRSGRDPSSGRGMNPGLTKVAETQRGVRPFGRAPQHQTVKALRRYRSRTTTSALPRSVVLTATASIPRIRAISWAVASTWGLS